MGVFEGDPNIRALIRASYLAHLKNMLANASDSKPERPVPFAVEVVHDAQLELIFPRQDFDLDRAKRDKLFDLGLVVWNFAEVARDLPKLIGVIQQMDRNPSPEQVAHDEQSMVSRELRRIG